MPIGRSRSEHRRLPLAAIAYFAVCAHAGPGDGDDDDDDEVPIGDPPDDDEGGDWDEDDDDDDDEEPLQARLLRCSIAIAPASRHNVAREAPAVAREAPAVRRARGIRLPLPVA